MDTMKDTKMQPAKDAVIEELRKVIADCYWPTSPVAINEILDRLEAAKKERDDAKAAAENIALKLDYLRSKFETAKNAQNDWLRANAPGGWIDNLRIENEALRAKVARMEKQVPICRAEDLKHAESPLPTLGLKSESPLYALPGAQTQGEEK